MLFTEPVEADAIEQADFDIDVEGPRKSSNRLKRDFFATWRHDIPSADVQVDAISAPALLENFVDL